MRTLKKADGLKASRVNRRQKMGRRMAKNTPAIDLGPLPKPHLREMSHELAQRELFSFMVDWRQKYNLTPCETACIMNELQSGVLYSALRTERRKHCGSEEREENNGTDNPEG